MKPILVLIFLFVNLICSAQDYQEKIVDLDKQIKQAIAVEDFEKASLLKSERELYTDLQQAIKDEDFEKAEQIKNKLEGEFSSDQSSIIQDCIIYFFAGETVGPIGGSISSARFETLKIASNEIKKVQIPAGELILKTNVTLDIYSVLKRELKPGKVYFIEFGDNFIADPNIKSATLRYVDLKAFNLATNANFEAPENFKIEDSGIKETPSKLNFSVETNCLNCRLFINGAEIVKNLKKKVVYSVSVPSEELSVTFHAKADNKKFKSVASFSQNISLSSKPEHFLEIDFNLFGKILRPANIKELTIEEFKVKTENFNLTNLKPFSY